MLTERKLDAFFEGLLYAGCAAFAAMMLLNQTDYWLVAGAIAGVLTLIAAMLNLMTKEDNA